MRHLILAALFSLLVAGCSEPQIERPQSVQRDAVAPVVEPADVVQTLGDPDDRDDEADVDAAAARDPASGASPAETTRPGPEDREGRNPLYLDPE